jgi:hypothetical protein
MECRPVTDVLVTGAAPCCGDDTLLFSLFINLVLCHQICLGGTLLIAGVTCIETGLSGLITRIAN